MSDSDFYYVIERQERKFTKIYRVGVGVRRIGINAYVRSMLAFGNFERDTQMEQLSVTGSGYHLPRAFLVLSSGQYQHYLSISPELADCVAESLVTTGRGFVDCAFPRDLYAVIGYDPKRKRYAPTLDT